MGWREEKMLKALNQAHFEALRFVERVEKAKEYIKDLGSESYFSSDKIAAVKRSRLDLVKELSELRKEL